MDNVIYCKNEDEALKRVEKAIKQGLNVLTCDNLKNGYFGYLIYFDDNNINYELVYYPIFDKEIKCVIEKNNCSLYEMMDFVTKDTEHMFVFNEPKVIEGGFIKYNLESYTSEIMTTKISKLYNGTINKYLEDRLLEIWTEYNSKYDREIMEKRAMIEKMKKKYNHSYY